MYKKRGLADSGRYYSSTISNRCWEVCLPRPLTACASESSLANSIITGYQICECLVARGGVDEQSFCTTSTAHPLTNTENLHVITLLSQMHEHGKINGIRLEDTEDILLIRKARFNECRYIIGCDFFPTFIVRQSISPFWAIVCIHWQDELIAHALVMLTVPIADNPLIDGLLKLAGSYREYSQIEVAEIHLMILFIAFQYGS